MKQKKQRGSIFIKIVILMVLVCAGMFVIKVAPNYRKTEITDKVNLVINCTNVTSRMKQDLIIDEQGIVYLSMNDIMNYYDNNIYYDEQYNHIVTSSENKLAVLELNNNQIEINDKIVKIKGSAMQKNNIYYLPISEMEDVYNIKVNNTGKAIVIESLDRQITTAKATKKVKIKSKAVYFSRTLEKIEKDSKVVIAQTEPNTLPYGWVKVRTENGTIGYTELSNLSDTVEERENITYKKQFNQKISLVWDYFSEFGKAPDNTDIKYNGVNVVSPSFFNMKLQDLNKENLTREDIISQVKIEENVGEEGIAYINWAKNNGYEIWPKVSNDTISTTIDEFSHIINDYELRKLLINDIIRYVEQYQLDGINLDFEYMYKKDKDAFSKFVIELAPRLREKNVCLSVDVTAPDGGDNWSLCYDRNVLGEAADYLVFMGYDQYGTTMIGTTSGYNWVKNSIKKFIEQEEVNSDRIILGLPFYTKIWKTKDDKTISSSVVSIKNINEKIPQNAIKEWKEDLQQYYIQYEEDGYIYKIWVEDEETLKMKLDLVNEYNLAGAAYWRKGFDSEEIWNIIKQKLSL